MTPSAPEPLPLIDDAHWPAALADLKGGFATRLNVYRMMAHSPELLRAWSPLREHVVLKGGLSETQRELAILRVGRRWRADYEWAHHVARGRLAGLTEAQIAHAEVDEPVAAGADAADAAILKAVDALLAEGRLAPEQAERLGAQLGVAAVLDLFALVGFYSTLAFIAKTFAVPLEPDVAALAPDWNG